VLTSVSGYGTLVPGTGSTTTRYQVQQYLVTSKRVLYVSLKISRTVVVYFLMIGKSVLENYIPVCYLFDFFAELDYWHQFPCSVPCYLALPL